MITKKYISTSTDETEKIGALLANNLLKEFPSCLFFITLKGGLGAGKTAFTRGFASVISPSSKVKSPSFTIVNEYRSGKIPLFHFDLYRLGENADLSEIGFDEYVESGHCIVEWSEYLNESLPKNAVNVTIEKNDDNKRTVTISYNN